MTGRQQEPPFAPLLERLVSGSHGDALAGDLMEQHRNGRSSAWFWRQAALAILISGARDRTRAPQALLPCLILFLFVVATRIKYPGNTLGLLMAAIAVLLVSHTAFAFWAWQQRGRETRNALEAGGQGALIVGAIFISNHIVWCFLPLTRPAESFASGAGATLVMFGLFCAVGAMAWMRTHSVLSGMLAGAWCASAASLTALSFALGLNHVLGPESIPRFHDAFVADGTSNAAFVAHSALRTVCQDLVRMPLTGAFLGFAGAQTTGWLRKRRGTAKA